MPSTLPAPGPRIVALVATKDRPGLLVSRSLASISEQRHRCDHVLVVDDASSADPLPELRAFEKASGLEVSALRNRRTHGAAGAWNTGLDHLARSHSDPTAVFVAFLDDDDAWGPDYLGEVARLISAGGEVIASAFHRIAHGEADELVDPPHELVVEEFFVGNPGIQPSGLVVRLDRLLESGGFDESLRSCTDRDLCIRLARIGGVKYLRNGRSTVRHYACMDRPRLCTPGSPARLEGLQAFFDKHGPEMSPAQRSASEHRAADLFGWRPPVMAPAAESTRRVAAADESTQLHLVVGIISDRRRTTALDALLGDLHDLGQDPGLVGLDVVVLENGAERPEGEDWLAVVDRWRRHGLRLHCIDLSARSQAVLASELEANPQDRLRWGIGPARTALQTYLYHFAKARPGSVVWVLDDDMRLQPLVDNGATRKRQRMPLISKLAALKSQGVDVAVGRYTGAPPLPVLSTVRVQMIDLLASLRWLAKLDATATLPDLGTRNRLLRTGRRDYYYDLSHRETDRLETPFLVEPDFQGETVGQALERLSLRMGRLLAGEQIFRPLSLEANEAEAFEQSPGMHRGGNTFVFDVEALADAPNSAPEIDGRPTRRSDMIWALIQRDICKRRVVSVPLAVYHAREGLVTTPADDERCLADDIRGFALFTALQDHLGNPSVCMGTRTVKYMEERLAALRLSLHRTRGLASELLDLATAPGFPDGVAARMRAFARQVLERVDAELFDRIAADVRELSAARADAFKDQLPESIDQHRRRMARVTFIAGQLASQRNINALATVQRLAADEIDPATPLQILGQGCEAVVVTDGTRVLKVFDYWKDRDASRAQTRMRRLVGRWPQGKGLYPLESFTQSGVHAIVAYPFESSEPYRGSFGPGLVDLVADCFQQGLACRNIHPKNLRVVGDQVRLVDYGGDLLLRDECADFDAEFEAMCRRAFLSWRFWHRADLNELLRRSTSDRHLPELTGHVHFLAAVQTAIGQRDVPDPVLVRAMELRPERVLDFGCGKGELSRRLQEVGCHVVAYDPDASIESRLRNMARPGLAPTFTFDQAAAQGPFDLVVCRRVVCLLEDLALTEVLAQLRSCVREGGRVLLALCHPLHAPRIPTHEAQPLDGSAGDPETTFTWRKRHRHSQRLLLEVHRPERVLRRAFRRAGFHVVGRSERPCVGLDRFEEASDLLVFELAPVDPPQVSLMIKACAMEAETLAVQVRHLVQQLEQPHPFGEVLLVLDSKEDGFLRQHASGDRARLRAEATILMAQGWIDRVVEAPRPGPDTAALNARWLGYAWPDTHAGNGAPLAVPFSGFEACQTRYVLQADLDVMIGRADPKLDYQQDMIAAMAGDELAVTAAFNIAHLHDTVYTAQGTAGPWRTEARICLLDLDRLRSLLPLAYSGEPGLHEPLAWHRALDRVVSSGQATSLRGGDHRTFFVHPSNAQKSAATELFGILAQVERGVVPRCQLDSVDLRGTYRDWVAPTRFEQFVFIITGRNVIPSRFWRCIESVLAQRFDDWGAVIIDDASHPSWAAEQERVCGEYAHRMTFARRASRRGLLANTAEAIRMHCGNPRSVIVTLDADDCLIAHDVLDELDHVYRQGADLTVGSMCRTDKAVDYPVDFNQPRLNRGGNVWQHLRTFRKSLFDALPDNHLRLDGEYVDIATDWAFMLPLVETAVNPHWIRKPLYLHEPGRARDVERRLRREAVIARLVALDPLAPRLAPNPTEVT
jgi:2-polyprenyl-3-methyl-5-hydroxy-6-metoxy-1,4-benzoquinol methylase/GT2 family glycosyltransferase